ncbi:MAG: hypothetical protein AB7K73_04585 [Gammaproteobacteria bacterium]
MVVMFAGIMRSRVRRRNNGRAAGWGTIADTLDISLSRAVPAQRVRISP